ncbi:ribbon-helix-helix protein, CopG family [Demequina sp. NBRC 110056]|uniref:ribbon-helix-helix protein, CopG family n=1 Tax=Demequina sp. NBRC 110056 TaxID=1570345 RepID=UPI00190EC049|nr:ribbon-helix-helix protein, CopG family [Demequina sp. NBRC 110056]
MTVRMTEEQDARLTELAQRWGVSKNEAIARAVEEASRAESTEAEPDVSAVSREMLDRWGPVLDRLGTV